MGVLEKPNTETSKMSKAPFLLPPQFYKNLFAASAILQKPPATTQSDCNKLFNSQSFARNLLFSCGDGKEVIKQSPQKNISG
jgi:hypothetical protein